MSRKETPLQQGKPVFSQSGNTSNSANIVTVTPTTPTPAAPTLQGTNVRRSSRLFSHSYSVKVDFFILLQFFIFNLYYIINAFESNFFFFIRKIINLQIEINLLLQSLHLVKQKLDFQKLI